MPNRGLLPGDIITSMAEQPGLMFSQPLDPTLGYNFHATSAGAATEIGSLHIELSPDNNTLLSVRSAAPRLHLRPVTGDGPIVTPVNDLPGPGRRCAWRPDGSRFAATHANVPYVSQYEAGTLNLLTALSPAPTAVLGEVQYSPDGSMLALGYDAGSGVTAAPGFLVYDVDSGTQIDLTGAPSLGSDCFGAAFSPDSSMLFCIPRTSGVTHFPIIYDVNDWTTPIHSFSGENVHSFGIQQKYVAWSPDGSKVAFYRGGTTAATVLVVVETATWTQLDISALSLNAAAIQGLRWLNNDILIVKQAYCRVIDFSTGAGVQLGTQQGGNTGVAIAVRPGGVRRKFSGVVTDGGAGFLERVVRAVDKTTGRLLAETISDPGDGTFQLIVFSPNPAIVYCVGQGAEITKLSDGVTPVPL